MSTELASPPVNRIERLESTLDRARHNEISVSSSAGGMAVKTMAEVMEFAKLMALSDVSIPRHLRGNAGACLAICIQAIEWKMSPYAVANKSYVVNDRIAYESQLIHAVIEQRAPLKGRLRNSYSGEGDSRKCKVWAHIEGEDEPLIFQSAEFGRIQPKNSPLWKTKPDLQLFYNASRDWARMYFPDVIMGVYSDDELAAATAPKTTVSLQAAIDAAEPSAGPLMPPEPKRIASKVVSSDPPAPESSQAPKDLPASEPVQPAGGDEGAGTSDLALEAFADEGAQDWTTFAASLAKVAAESGADAIVPDTLKKLKVGDAGSAKRSGIDARKRILIAAKVGQFDFGSATILA
jgi:hypothetical protein